MNRAYSILSVKAAGTEDERVIEGMATTPTPDRMDDIIEPLGVQFKNPLVLLHQHDHGAPIGSVTFEKPTEEGIKFRAVLPNIKEAGKLKDRIDMAWAEVKAGLVRAVSIGFRPLDDGIKFLESGGIHFLKTEVFELSLVSVPANADATITLVKSIDAETMAASGRKSLKPIPAATGDKRKPIAKGVSKMAKKTYAEQITAFRDTREEKSLRMNEIMDEAEGATLDEAQTEEFDTLESEIGQIDQHVKRLRTLQRSAAETARDIGDVSTAEKAAASRGDVAAPVILKKGDKDEAFEGQNYTRMVIAKTLARLDGISPEGIAQKRWGRDNPGVVGAVKAAVAGGGTDSGEWGAELVHIDRYTGDFIEYLYSRTVFDQLPLREVPANVNIAGQDGAATGYWVGQSKSVPVSKADFTDINLTPLKVAALAVVSKELLRDSSPSAERLVRDALVQASAQKVDSTFLSTDAAVSGVSPAGILNGLTAITSAGADIDGVIADVKALYAPFIAANNADGLEFVTTQSLAKSAGLMQNALGNWAFPGIGANGGTLLGDKVTAGGNVGTGDLILLKPSDIYKIGDRGVEVSMSTEAAVQMDNAPNGASDTPTANTSVVSMFQTDSVAIKVVRPLNFAKRRSSAVAYVGDADYGTIGS